MGGLFSGCISTAPVVISAHKVYSPPLHWMMTTPASWEFIPQEQIRKGQRAANSTNTLLNYVVYQDAVVPFVVAHRVERINSNYPVSFTIVRESLEEDRFLSDDQIVGRAMGNYLYLMTGARVIGPLVTVKIAGQNFTNGRLTYPLKFRDGATFEIRREFWAHRVGHAAVIVTATYDMRDVDIAAAEVRQIIESISENRDQ